MRKIKILILQANLKDYRTILFNSLSKKYFISVISFLNDSKIKSKFSFALLPYKKFLFIKYNVDLHKIIQKKEKDIVVVPDHFEWISFLLIGILPRKYPILWFGFSIPKKNYIYQLVKLEIFKFILKKNQNDQLLFYDYISARKSIKKLGFSLRSHVLNNTFITEKVNKKASNIKKNFIINIGSLNRRKGNYELIEAFYAVINKIPEDIKLVIVGNGKEEDRLKILLTKLGLESRVLLKKGTYDHSKIMDYYSRSIASISLNQAGLSILQSFSYKVPFITKSNSVSGGEISNIYHGFNGFLIGDNRKEIEDIIIFVAKNPQKMNQMGINALNTYKLLASEKTFKESFDCAIKSSLGSKLI